MNLETNSELDLSYQPIIWKKLKVFGSRSWSISELEQNFWIRNQLWARSENKKITNPENLWIALLIDFWTRTEFLNLETNSELDLKKSENRPELYLKKIKSLWIDFWTRIEFLNLKTKPELDLKKINSLWIALLIGFQREYNFWI